MKQNMKYMCFMCSDEEGRADQLRPVTAGSQPMGSIDHYIDRGRNERSENDQLMNNSGVSIGEIYHI